MSDQEQVENQWSFAAAALGFNELAKMQKDIRLKVFCRAMRAEAEKSYKEAGGKLSLFNENGRLREVELSLVPMPIIFIESDINLLRQLVSDYDAGKV